MVPSDVPAKTNEELLSGMFPEWRFFYRICHGPGFSLNLLHAERKEPLTPEQVVAGLVAELKPGFIGSMMRQATQQADIQRELERKATW